jgi:hypothetical protein
VVAVTHSFRRSRRAAPIGRRAEEPLKNRVKEKFGNARWLSQAVGLIRFGGHLSKGEYDVHTDGRDNQKPAGPPAVR